MKRGFGQGHMYDKIRENVKGEFGQADANMSYMPELEKKQDEHALKQETTIKVDVRADELLKHNEEYNGIVYKYDLPTVNQPITFRSLNMLQTIEDEKNSKMTATENLLNELECDKDTAFESFIIKMQ